MTRLKYPKTPSVRILGKYKISFIPHLYKYEHQGGTKHAAAILNVPEHAVVKTLVMTTETNLPLIVLMHGDREVSTKKLARLLGVKRVSPCDTDMAQKHTGFLIGGTGPFGTKKKLPVYVESSILLLDRIFINGGKRGFLMEIDPGDLAGVLSPKEINVAIRL